MTTTPAALPSTLRHMAKSNPGKRAAQERINVAVPAAWHAVLRQLAARRQQPITFTLIALIIGAAEQAQIETPTPPWEVDDGD